MKRNNLIFSYLQNHEDFYRMSEYYLSHDNPSIRSINKLLRDNQTKSVDNAASQWIEEMKKASENIRALQKENEDTVLTNLRMYIEFENTLFQQKASQYQNLKNEITLLKKLNPNEITDDKTLQKIKTENLENTTVLDKITEIGIILFRLDEKSNQTLKDYLDQSEKYNENKNNSARYQSIIEQIGQLISYYKEDDQNETVLNETLTQIQGLSKIEDEEKKAKQTENLKKRLNGIHLVKKNIISTLKELIEKSTSSNKSNEPFYLNYLMSLMYVKCIEMEMITSISKMKLNSKVECDKRDINTEFDNFKMNARRFLSKKVSQYKSQIEKIIQKQNEVSTNNSQSEIKELENEINELNEKKGKKEEEKENAKKTKNVIIARTPGVAPTGQSLLNVEKQDKISEKLNQEIEDIEKQISSTKIKIKDLESSKKAIVKKSKSYVSLLSQKTNDLKGFEDKSRNVFDSMGKAYILINRVNNMLEAMKKKKDEMDKKKSNNRLLQSMQNDMLFKEIIGNKLISAAALGNSRYKLVIGKSAKDFKKRIPVLKKYFESKNKFYENRGSILSALSFNVNAIASAFTNETPKNISFNEKQFADIFTSPSSQNVKPMNYATSTQSQFGAPSPTAYAVQQQPYNPPPQRPAMFGGYMGQGGATQMNKPPEKKPVSSYEFITILDKVFEDLKGKVRSNEVYENRLNVFLKFLDERDRQLNEEILAKLNRVEKISKPEYEFIFPAQIKFITRRVFRIQDFMNTPRNNSQMKHIYMTDFILMYFSLHYILSNFLDLILKPQAFNELNA